MPSPLDSYPTEFSNALKSLVKISLLNTASLCIQSRSAIAGDFTQDLADHLYRYSLKVLENPDLYIDIGYNMLIWVRPTLYSDFGDGTLGIDYIVSTSCGGGCYLFQCEYIGGSNFSGSETWNENIFFHMSNIEAEF